MGKKRDREGSPAKKKQKKSKKHKRKHERVSDAEEIDVVNNDLNEGKGLKLKIKFGGRTLSTTELVSDSTMDEDVNIESEEEEESQEFKPSSQEKASSSKKKIKEDEEKWLEALDKGELDDHGEIKKERDIGMMTVRQRALHGEVSKDHMETLQQLPMYPERTEEENEEIERKRQLRAKKRKQQMQRQIEETKAQTVEKLLTKGQKNKKETAKSQRKLGDHVRYTSNQHGIVLSFSDGVEFPFESQQPKRWQMMETDVLTMENVVTELGHVEIIVSTMESGEKFLQYRGVTFQNDIQQVNEMSREKTKKRYVSGKSSPYFRGSVSNTDRLTLHQVKQQQSPSYQNLESGKDKQCNNRKRKDRSSIKQGSAKRIYFQKKHEDNCKINFNQDEFCEQKHLVRGLHETINYIPPKSPFHLIQEELHHNPWQMLLATIFLHRTNGKVALPVFWDFIKVYKVPDKVSYMEYDAIADLMQPLGLNKKRAKLIIRFTEEYLNKNWKYPIELYGIGKYGNDSYRIFCLGQWKEVHPSDVKLNQYHNWLIEQHKLGMVD